MPSESRRQRHERLRVALKNRRSSWEPHWQELADFIWPTKYRITPTETEKGQRKNHNIIDNTATLALRTLKGGMLMGITSPARPWFRLTVANTQLAELPRVRTWLSDVTRIMLEGFARSNYYTTAPNVFGAMGCFGTGAMSVEEDFERIFHTQDYQLGTFWIATDPRGKVNTFFREFTQTVAQIIERWGLNETTGEIDWTNISQHVRQLWIDGNRHVEITVCHVTEPNDEWDPNKDGSRYKRWRSSYYEKSSTPGLHTGNNYSVVDENKYLSVRGFDFFPFLVPRWDVGAEEDYGTDSPGMSSIGDVRQLQKGEKKIGQGISKIVSPPLTVPASLRHRKVSLLPGDATAVDIREGQQGVRPIHEVDPRVLQLENKQAQVRQRIDSAFFARFFLLLMNSDRREITAREIDELSEEKLIALGQVLERLNQDMLNDLIDIVFVIMDRQGLIPEAPPELQGMELKVEYISILAQAQKAAALASIERFVSYVLNVAQVDPTVLDKVDLDQSIDEVAEVIGVPPRMIVSDDEVVEIRQARAQAQQQQAAMESVVQGADAAKTLSDTDVTQDSALKRILDTARAGQLFNQVA